MKRLLIGCAALALLGGAQAFAQQDTTNSTGSSQPTAQQPDTGVVSPGATAGQTGSSATSDNTGTNSGSRSSRRSRNRSASGSGSASSGASSSGTLSGGATNGTGSDATRADTGSAGVGSENQAGAALNDGTTGGSTATTNGLASTGAGGGYSSSTSTGTSGNFASGGSSTSGGERMGRRPSKRSGMSYQRADASSEAVTTGGTTVGDMAQSNPAPGSYPVCSSRKQDRCTVASQSRHMARAGRHSSTRTGA